MQDGTEVQFKSVTLQKYISAENGGGMKVTVDRDVASSWETFRVRITIELLIVVNNLPVDISNKKIVTIEFFNQLNNALS